MKRKPKPYQDEWSPWRSIPRRVIQPPLPDLFDTPPIVQSIPGQGSGRERPSPLAPPGRPAND